MLIEPMTRYEGRQDPNAVGRDFPHFVDIGVPPGGLVNQLHAIYEFHGRRSIPPQRGQFRRGANGTVIRWWFADPDAARDFASEFGGTRTFHRSPASLLALSDF
jgi:hypothetical protein